MGDDIMKIFYSRKEYKMLQDENTAIRKERDKYRDELNAEYMKETAYLKKYNELLEENKKLKDKCAAYNKHYFEGTKPSEEIQEKVLNKLSSIEAAGLCNSALQNYYYSRTNF